MVAPSFTKTLFLLAFGLTYTTAAVANPSVSSNAAVLDDEDPVPEDLIVSTDGSCGGGITCLGSRFGDCCSEYGYCGRTYAYCGPGCQSAFGFCDPDVEQPSSTIETVFTTVTATVTSIIEVTRTSVISQDATLTSTVTVTAGATATTTAVITSTVTTTVTATVPAVTATAVRRADVIVPATTRTSTTIITLTTISTSVTTRTSIDTLTTIVTATTTRTVSSACILTTTSVRTTTTTATRTTGSPTTVTSTQGPRPTLTIPGTPRDCKHYSQIRSDDTCRSLAQRNGLTLLDFYNLNPLIDCDKLLVGYYVCVGK